MLVLLLASLLSMESGGLTGKWRVTKMASKNLPKGVKPPTVEFLPDGKVAGFGGCNRFGGNYQVEGTRLKLGALAATRMACVGEGMKVEDQFFKLFAEELRWKSSRDRIEFKDSRNKTVMRLQLDR